MNKTLFTEEQLNQIEYGKMELLDVSKYANPELTPNQMRLLRLCLSLEVPVDGYNIPEIPEESIYQHLEGTLIKRLMDY